MSVSCSRGTDSAQYSGVMRLEHGWSVRMDQALVTVVACAVEEYRWLWGSSNDEDNCGGD